MGKVKYRRGALLSVNNQHCLFLRRVKNKQSYVVMLDKNGKPKNIELVDTGDLENVNTIPIHLNELY